MVSLRIRRTFPWRGTLALAFASGAILGGLMLGCASTGFLMATANVTMFREPGAPKPDSARIDVYQTARPDRPFEEVARIECGDTDDAWNMKQITTKAREIGADGIIILGRVGSYDFVAGSSSVAGSVATGTGFGVGQGYGLSAVAIRYK